MTQELTVSFAGVDKFTIGHNNQTTAELSFASPLIKEDWQDMRWYLEVFATQYAADVDDERADRVVKKLKVWGQGLFVAVFGDRSAARMFNAFQDGKAEGRQISIAASEPEILRLPWELLCDSAGTFLLHENPRVGLRRRFAGAGGGRQPLAVKPKKTLHLLMVVSRPQGAGFIDPRAEGRAVLRAIERSAPGRIVVEFLRPATLQSLRERLDNKKLPPIDILHFDGHGVFAANNETGAGKHDGLTKGGSENMGCLLFEDADGKRDSVNAQVLGDVFNRQKISLVVLSACQSAMVGEDDALGCLAAKLTDVGIPAVLAMTYSVLVKTTEQLFGKFYGDLAGGESLGVALVSARQDLFFEQKRGKRWRGNAQIDLKLADWFLPAWYQAGADLKLLKPVRNGVAQVVADAPGLQQLPKLQEEGFFGRSRELWFIERAFVQGTRRLTIAGFGGQGKTYLAAEAGRWLVQTGMFEVVCFVDYASFQGVDAVGYGMTVLGVALEQSLLDAAAVTRVLQGRRTLVILDNLESLAAAALGELLTVAKGWSEAGESRLLLTTRDGGLSHADYPAVHSLQHQLLSLAGLGKEDALDYFQGLMKLPPVPQWDLPNREALLELFKLVDFHPLSIRLVALQLKERRIGDLAKNLELLLAEGSPGQDKQRSLVASLNLSLQRLDPELLVFLPRLGVFQGGALEDAILAVTEIASEQWAGLKSALVRTGLVQMEDIREPFLRFHPTLAPVLWGRLAAEEEGELSLQYQEYYYALVNYLYGLDSQKPEVARLIVKWELPNLLWAVKGALAEQAENTAAFVDRVNWFLGYFGLKRDREYLTEQLQLLVSTVGSNNWYLVRTNQGKQLYDAGQYAAAAEIFTEILQELGTVPSFNGVNTLNRLGLCFEGQGQLAKAAECLQAAINLAEQLEQSNNVKKQRGTLQADLGDVLTDLGQYSAAQQAYEKSLAILQELGDQRGVAVAEGQLGKLAMAQGDLTTAEQKYQSALHTFQQLQEPETEAVAWHQLGIVYEKGQQWAAADRSYRKAASIKEQQGNLTGASSTYCQLAIVSVKINKLTEAEDWYRKALLNFRKVCDRLCESKILHNLADLLSNQPSRLPEAQQLAIEALAIKQTLDPAASLIWTTYNLLAKIAAAQGENQPAQAYRQQARSTKAAFAGTQYELQKHEPLITAVVAAVANQTAAEELESLLTKRSENGREQLVIAIRRIMAGGRSIEALWDDLDMTDSMIIHAITDRLNTPQS